MKRLLLFITIILLAACRQQKEYPEQLVQADSIMATYPDSALFILNAYKDTTKQINTSVKMYYTLLLTLAKDKCRQTHETDTLMPEVIEYYESQGDNKKLSWAYYTLARIYNDIKNYPKALDCYQKAIDNGQEVGDYRLIGLAYSQIGLIYHYNHMYDELIDSYRKSYEYALLANDTLAMACRLSNMARVYTVLNNVDSTLYYYNKSYEIDHDPITKSTIADIYIQIGEYDKAYKALLDNRKSTTMWAEYYDAIGENDSAIFYYKQTLSKGDIYSKLDAAHKMTGKAESDGNVSAALFYLKKEREYRDSIDKVTNVAELKRVEIQSKMEKAEKLRNDLEMENHFIWISLLSVLSCSLLVMFIIYRRYKIEKERNEKNLRIATIKEMSEVEDIDINSDSKKNKLCHIMENKDTFTICNNIFSGKDNENYILRESDWSSFMEEINIIHPSFTQKLQLIYPSIKKKEMCICCLMMLDLKSKDIAHIICMSNNGLSTLQMRLYKKLTGNEGKARELKDVLNGLL